MRNAFQDIRHALRIAEATPAFTLTAILTLTVAIGGIATIFSVVNGVLLRPLPYRDAERLVTMTEVRNIPAGSPYAPPARGFDWPDQSGVFEGRTFFGRASYTMLAGDVPVVVDAARVPPNHLSVMGVAPEKGRDFVERDGQPSASPVAIVTHGFWQRRLGGDPDILGRTLKFAEGSFAVVGVMPRSFVVPWDTSLEFLIAVPEDSPATLFVGRLRQGITPAQAQQRIETLVRQIDQAYPAVKRSVRVTPLQIVDGSDRTLLLLLFCAVGSILLIAIINMANLMMSRNLSRRHEFVVRAAIGASRARVARQLFTESLLLRAAGGALGLLAAFFGVDAVVSKLPPAYPRIQEIVVDERVAGFLLMVTVVSTIAFGLTGALSSSRVDLNEALTHGSGRATQGSRRRYFQSVLITVEIALASVLLIGAALTAKSFWTALHFPLGVDTENVATASFRFPSERYSSETVRSVVYAELLDRLNNQPEVEKATLTTKLPAVGGFFFTNVTVEGTNSTDDRVVPVEATGSYFEVFKIPFLAGRAFRDDEQAVVINQTLAHRLWPNSNPLGSRLKTGPASDSPWQTVVGVVSDFRMNLEPSQVGQIFRRCSRCTNLAMRMRNDSANVAQIVRSRLAEIDQSVIVTRVSTMDGIAVRGGRNRRFAVSNVALWGLCWNRPAHRSYRSVRRHRTLRSTTTSRDRSSCHSWRNADYHCSTDDVPIHGAADRWHVRRPGVRSGAHKVPQSLSL